MRITSEQSDALLATDLARFEPAVDDAVKVHMSQGQYDALVSLAFNIGAKAFANSTVVRKLNAGDIRGAGDAFLMWTHAGGKFVQGLMNRRQSERAQFLAGTNAKTR